MRFMRIGPLGEELPVIATGDEHFDLRSITDDITPEFLARGGLASAQLACERGELAPISAKNQRIGAPVTGSRAVVCIGQNYAAHAAESGSAPPEEPIVFFKHPSSVVGPNDEIHPIPTSSKLDWEVELAVVLKSQARRLKTHAEALQCIAGITISNDVSDRHWQIERSGGQWSKGKSWETFNPLGPFLQPLDGTVQLDDMRLQSWVNGQIRQDSSTSDMIFSVADIILHLSQVMILDPGDIINTGTPQGVALSGRFPYLEPGDQIRLAISGLGEQVQTVVAVE